MTKTATVIGDTYDAWRTQDVEWLDSYLPEDFHHVIHIPVDMHPVGGTHLGKAATIERLRMVTVQFDFLRFDTSDLMIQRDRAGLEIPVHYRRAATCRRRSQFSGRSRTAGLSSSSSITTSTASNPSSTR